MRARLGLTPREMEIGELIAALGLSNRQIGDRLGISEGTVRDHLKAIYRNFRLRGRHQGKRMQLILVLWSKPEWRASLVKHW